MATEKQRAAARKNIKKAQAAWKTMSHGEHARSQQRARRENIKKAQAARHGE